MGWKEELKAEIKPGMTEDQIETVMARDHNMYTNTMIAILLMEIRDELKKPTKPKITKASKGKPVVKKAPEPKKKEK